MGGGAAVSIQSMCNTPTEDVNATVRQIQRLEQAGCEIVRVAVPTEEAARAIPSIKAAIHIPLVADIHFDYRLALLCVDGGVDKIRINPGNIGSKDRVRAVADACRERGIPIRVGVNGGSLEKDLVQKYGGVTAEALAESALGHVHLLEECGFGDICISVKCSRVPVNMAAYELLHEKVDYPLHLGVTEAGTPEMGVLKSAIGIGGLLCRGIGDTLRVSLTADPVEEVVAVKRILQACGLRRTGPDLIACPTCGRTKYDMLPIAREVERRLKSCDKPITVAVMGCVVNGPGEASAADVGIAGGRARDCCSPRERFCGRCRRTSWWTRCSRRSTSCDKRYDRGETWRREYRFLRCLRAFRRRGSCACCCTMPASSAARWIWRAGRWRCR